MTAHFSTSALRDWLSTTRTRDPDHGACLGMPPALRKEFMTLLQQWPKYSGDPEYPIPHPTETPRSGFISADDLWAGAYGDLRREAIEWCKRTAPAVVVPIATPKVIYKIPKL